MQDHLYVDLCRSSLFSINVSFDSPRKNKTLSRFVKILLRFKICRLKFIKLILILKLMKTVDSLEFAVVNFRGIRG